MIKLGRFITVYQSIGGWKAVEMWFNNEEPDIPEGFWEPWQTSMFGYDNKEEAVMEAKAWAYAEGLPYYPQGVEP